MANSVRATTTSARAEVADSNGRQLGYAAAAAIESLPPPGTDFVYTGIVASGANLGAWEYQPCLRLEQLLGERRAAGGKRGPTSRCARKVELGVVASLSGYPRTRSRSRRRLCAGATSARALGDDPVFEMPIWTWRLGGALLVAIPNEPYSVFQVELRRRVAPTPLLVLGVTNRTMGYLFPEETYGTWVYQEQQSPFAPGCLEQTIEVCSGRARGVARQLVVHHRLFR